MLTTGHRRIADQNGDDQQIAPGERHRDLLAQDIVRVVDSTLTGLIRDRRLVGPDHCDQCVAPVDLGLDAVGEPLAWLECGDVPKQLVFAEAVTKRVAEAARIWPAVPSPVADEYPAHTRCLSPQG